MLSPVLNACRRLAFFGPLCVSASAIFGGTAFVPVGGEYPVVGLLRGDQTFPSVSRNSIGGLVVWQDNATDGDGFGISARRVNGDLLGSLGLFRVNEQGSGDQQNPRVKMLNDGGAVVVWQGGPEGGQDIYARWVGKDGTFVTGDVRINTYTDNQQMNPAVTVLLNDRVVVVWSSFGQDGSMQGIYGQVLSSSGEKIGGEFQVNQYTSFNQRTPTVSALSNGDFVVAWISEQKRFENSVDVYARVFAGASSRSQSEFLVNASKDICANPTADSTADGGFILGWGQRDIGSLASGWDVYVRAFSSGAQPAGTAAKVNSHPSGNHYAPQIAGVGDQHLVVWTSVGQDGSREGVFGRFVASDASMVGPEFQVNTASASQQIHPAVSADGKDHFVVTWSSFIGGATSFDVFAQRFGVSLLTPAAPFVSALSSSRLSVTWPDAAASAVSGYELYIDDNSDPVVVTGNIWSLQSLAPASKHSVKLAYRFSGGGRSAFSEIAIGTTWGSDENLDGLPDDWQAFFFGADTRRWPDPKTDSDGDGASDAQEFLAGTNPVDSTSVLRTKIVTTEQGTFLHWNTQTGFVYQLQTKADLSREWVEVGQPRFAASTGDSVLIEGAKNLVYYRVKRLR